MNNETVNMVKTIIKAIEASTSLGKNTAAIFDIDGTLMDEKTYVSIQPVVYLYNYVKSRGITPFIITARSNDEMNKSITIKQLNNIGVDNYKYLYMRPKQNFDVLNYKWQCRKNILDNGYNTLFSIGDQYVDIGDYGGLGFIVPK